MAVDDPHFQPEITEAAARGALMGAIGAVAMVLVAIVLTDSSMDLLAAAALAAAFGGSAFGAMLGASAAASREPIPLPVRTDPSDHHHP